MVELTIWLCAGTAFLCAWLLLRAYFQHKIRLFLWTGLYFVVLTINTLLFLADRQIFTSIDFKTDRLLFSLVGMILLVWGLIFESEEEG